MNREQARLECEALVAELAVPDPFDLGEFCAYIGRLIDRDVVLMSHSMVIGGLCGTWMRTAKADYIFYEADTSLLHQLHIILHEIGHILRRHVPGNELSKDLVRLMAPGMKVSDVFRVLGRDSYSDDDEFEAELIATRILRRIGLQTTREQPKATDPKADDVVARISASMLRGD